MTPGYYWVRQRGRYARTGVIIGLYRDDEWRFGGGAGTDDRRRLSVLAGPLQPPQHSSLVLLKAGYYWAVCHAHSLIVEYVADEWAAIDDECDLAGFADGRRSFDSTSWHRLNLQSFVVRHLTDVDVWCPRRRDHGAHAPPEPDHDAKLRPTRQAQPREPRRKIGSLARRRPQPAG